MSANSIGQAATALREWALTLAALQDEARTLDRAAGADPPTEPPLRAYRTNRSSIRVWRGRSAGRVRRRELNAVKDFDNYGKWRAIDIASGQTTWSLSGAGIEAIPGTVRNWVNNVATGKDPWQEPADATAG